MFPGGQGPRNRHETIITEDEYLADVNGSVSFATTAFPYNPGQSATFPWLSLEAKQYEKYVTISAEPYYRPQVSAFATNGQSGKVMLSFDYDASDSPPTSKKQVEDTDPHIDCMPYQSMSLRLDPRQLNSQDSKYVRPGGLPGGADIKTYDGGILFVSTQGNTNTNVIGEIRIKYTIKLKIPVLESVASAPANNQVAWFQSTSAEAAGASSSAKTLALATASANGLQAVNTSGSILLPAGNYLVDAFIYSANSVPGDISQTNLDIQLSGVSIFAAGAPGTTVAADSTISASGYISVNGSTPLTLVSYLYYSGGTATVSGSMRITAV
jgi:hypothetical protein